MDEKHLNKVLEDHKTWLESLGGKRADLSNADLREVDLYRADLRSANLRGAKLHKADLCDAKLCGANLYQANFFCANLFKADLSETNLGETNFRAANLSKAILCRASMCETDFRRAYMYGVDLRGTILRGANLRGANLDQQIVQIGPIGSRNDYVTYNVKNDVVQCGCWRDYMGGPLADFIEQVNETYPEGEEDKREYRLQYLAVITMFKTLKENSRRTV